MKIIILIACFAVAVILLKGLWNMMKGGSPNRSQQLMRMRVAAQAIAVLIVVIALYMAR